MNSASILWRRLDLPGHEAARLVSQPAGWLLTGAAGFAYQGQACLLNYHIEIDAGWRTLSARITGWVGPQAVEVEVEASSKRIWRLNGAACPDVAGCLDLDLSFSPSTNLLPIRRLNLASGQAAAVRAAWLRFPSFGLEPLEQTYRRTGEATYQYESGDFKASLQINAAGFVTHYAGLWQAEAHAP